MARKLFQLIPIPLLCGVGAASCRCSCSLPPCKAPVLTSCFLVRSRTAQPTQTGNLNHYMDSSHAMPAGISSPSSHNPCKPTDRCVWHPKWTRTARGGKNEPLRGLVSASLCLVRSAWMLFVLVVAEGCFIFIFLTPLYTYSFSLFISHFWLGSGFI